MTPQANDAQSANDARRANDRSTINFKIGIENYQERSNHHVKTKTGALLGGGMRRV